MSTAEHAHTDALRTFPRCSGCRKIGFSRETPSCPCGGILEMVTRTKIRDTVTLRVRDADGSDLKAPHIDWKLWVSKSPPAGRKRVPVDQPPILTLEAAKRLTRKQIKEARDAFRRRWRI